MHWHLILPTLPVHELRPEQRAVAQHKFIRRASSGELQHKIGMSSVSKTGMGVQVDKKVQYVTDMQALHSYSDVAVTTLQAMPAAGREGQQQALDRARSSYTCTAVVITARTYRSSSHTRHRHLSQESCLQRACSASVMNRTLESPQAGQSGDAVLAGVAAQRWWSPAPASTHAFSQRPPACACSVRAQGCAFGMNQICLSALTLPPGQRTYKRETAFGN